ncbi:MAG: Type II secretion system protein E [Syntrophomonadaceae bacterium]|nr:Type II secretion system protein E [Bacillota bacterium]
MIKSEKLKLGEILLMEGFIVEENLREALLLQEEEGGKRLLGEILIHLGFLDREKLYYALSLQRRMVPVVNLAEMKLSPAVVKTIPEEIARRFNLIAIEKRNDLLVVATADPTDIVVLDIVKSHTGFKISPVKSSDEDILRAINEHYGEFPDIEKSLKELSLVETERVEDEKIDLDQLRASAADAPVINFVNLLFLEAVNKRASDLHIEPGEDRVNVRFRIDGYLQKFASPPKRMFSAIVSRVKIISNLNIAERRLPQDGRCRLKIKEKEIDIRVSTLPTIYGEKVVLRILDKEAAATDIKELGLEKSDLEKFKACLQLPYGMFLLTGPTGSGKTSTLYAGLNSINDPGRNIITVEDPVEYELKGINQVQVKPSIGLTFAATLRHILRQDPNVIMVGEIRDQETAEIAIRAALTGHLVLSTLHTNNSIAAVSRLMDMGIEAHFIASSLNLVMAQRLVRRLCPHCREIHSPDENLLDQLSASRMGKDIIEGAKIFSRGKGCSHCDYIGYRGRCGIFEAFELNDKIKKLILDGKKEQELRDQAYLGGMKNLRERGLEKVVAGLTTLEEVLGATFGGEDRN